MFIYLPWVDPLMSLKKTSSTIQIGFSLAETAANTFIEERVDLQLNPLDNEVFVVLAVKLDPETPDGLAATNTAVNASVSTTSLTNTGNLSQSQVIATAQRRIDASGFVDGGVGFEQNEGDTPPAMLDYIAIIATNDFFVQVKGTGNANAKGVSGRMYGYRAKADAATYAALVQSEVLSS